MTRQILLNAFDMATPANQSPGLWRHPEDDSERYTDPSFWVDLARVLEDGGFHGVFFADVLGQYDVFGGDAREATRAGVQFPQLDPMLLVPLMAGATSRIGFGVTSSVTYENPYLLARRFATLDHLTRGRVAWNIVTSYQESAARNLGLGTQLGHDERYDLAEEYLDVVYQLWESSFDEDAVRFDRAANTVVDPDRVRGIGHHGQRFDIPGPALVEPSRQRTPLLFQAGASSRGRAFAAKHAEAIFFSGYAPQLTRQWVDAVRDGLEADGRARDSVAIFNMATIVVDESDEAATRKLEGYREHVDERGALALFGGWTGVDLSQVDLDAPLEYVATDANQSALAAFTTMDPTRKWTVRELGAFIGLGGRGPVLVGSPTTVADELERWMDEADIDGFNITAPTRPRGFEDIARWVSPELRRRGLLAEPPADTTFRDAVLGKGDRLAADHYGARFRRGDAVAERRLA